VMTMSWHMMIEFEPPLVAFVVSSANYSFAGLRATKQCVIAVPARNLASKVVKVGNCSGRDVEKFKKFGLTPVPAEGVMPPLIACVVSNANHSFAALRATKECVIAVPALALAPKVVEVGNCSGRDVEKLERFGLTPAPAQRVAPPLVAECFANLECKVADTRFVNKYNLFVLEVLKAWIDPAQKNPKTIHHHGYGRFAVDGEMIKLKSRMR
jgi:flavin reductase (DIM6/NTAB) family NADH-FMN oxidoreductase RutF